ncbi:MAG: VC0807 family protein [Candidatus Woesearchaeota archaeon]
MRSYENPLVNISFNIVIPTLILVYLPLEPMITLLIAISFPIGYGVYDKLIRRQTNWISFIGLVSVLLTGGIGLLELDAFWIAVKEAAVPFVIGLFVLMSAYSRDPIVKVLLYTPAVLDVGLIASRIRDRGEERAFNRIFVTASYFLALSFLFSTIVNYVLARIIVTAPSGTALFNEQIGRMTALGFVVISVPMMVLMILVMIFIFRRLSALTGLSWEELVSKHGSEPDDARENEHTGAYDEPDEDAGHTDDAFEDRSGGGVDEERARIRTHER